MHAYFVCFDEGIVRYFIVCAKMEVSVVEPGSQAIQAAEHAQWPFVPYWNEVVNEKCDELTRIGYETGSFRARAERRTLAPR